MTRSYRPRSKGTNPQSYQKHELIKNLVDAQIAVAAQLLRGQQSALIVDLHAGDGHGVEPAQRHLFGPQQSRPTPLIALDAAMRLSRCCRVDLRLFELDPARLHALQTAVANRNPQLCTLSIEHDHRTLGSSIISGYDYVLAISDANGPKASGADLLEQLALQRARRPFDVIVVINVGALQRMRGLRSAHPAAQGAIAMLKRSYWWHDDPQEWAKRLGRRYVVATPAAARLGYKSMQGRIFLVTGFAANPPPGFRVVFSAADRGRRQVLDGAAPQSIGAHP